MTYEAYLTDGNTAERRAVRLTLDDELLQLLDHQDGTREEWSIHGLQLAEDVYAGQPVRLLHQQKGDARLTVADVRLLDELQLLLPHFRRRNFALSRTGSRLVWLVMVMVLLLGGLLWSVPYLSGPVARAVPLAWEEKLGQTVAQSLMEGSDACSNGSGQAALDALVQRLIARVDTPYDFTIRVSDNELINAFAAPGGHIVIFDGLIQFAESPEALAGILAHEIAHVVEHHSMEGMVRIMGTSFVLAAVVGDASALAGGVTSIGQQMLMLSHSRKDEAAADKLGVRLLSQADISTEGLIGFFRRLKEEHGNLPASLKLLSTHPLHDNRIESISTMIGGKGPAMSDAEWQSVKSLCQNDQDYMNKTRAGEVLEQIR